MEGEATNTDRGEAKRVNLNTEGGHVLLFEFASQMTLDEGGLDGWLSVSSRHSKIRGRERVCVRERERGTKRNGRNCKIQKGKSNLTLPVPPSPTRTSLKVGVLGASAMFAV